MSSGKLKVREYADMKSRLLLNIGLVHENLGDYDKCKPLLFDSIQLTKCVNQFCFVLILNSFFCY